MLTVVVAGGASPCLCYVRWTLAALAADPLIVPNSLASDHATEGTPQPAAQCDMLSEFVQRSRT